MRCIFCFSTIYFYHFIYHSVYYTLFVFLFPLDDVSRVYCLDATGGIQLFIDFLLDSDTRGHSQHFERLLYYASGAVSQRKRSALPSGGIQHPYAMPQALLKLLPADGSPPQFDHIVPRVQRGWEKGQTATSERQRRKDIRKILCLIADIFRNLIRRVDSHPAFIEAGGVECLVLLIHSEHLKVKQVAAATLAQVIPYASVQGNPGMEIIISALVMLLHLRYSDHLLYTAIQSINRLCVTERVKSYILSQTPILPVLLEMMPHVAEYVLVSVLDLFLALARHDPRAFNQVFIPMLGKVNKKSRQMAAVFFSFHRSNQPFHIQNQAFLLLCQICRNEMPNTTGGTTPSFRSADVFMTNEQTLRRTTDGVALNVSRETPASSNQSQGQSINSNTSSSSSCYQQRLAIFRRFGAEIGMLGLLIDRILMHTARSDLSLFARWMDILFFFLDDESVLADQEYSSAVTQLMHHLSQTAPLKITAADIQSSQESTRTALASHLSSKNTKKSWMWNSQLAGGTGGLDLSDLKACDARIIDNAKTVVVRMASHLCSDTMMSTENNIQSLSEAFSLKLDSTLPRRRGEGELELGSLLQSRIKDKRRHATSTELATLAPSLSTATTSQLLKSGKVDAKKATSRAPPFTTSTNSGTEADNKTVSDPEQTEGEELRLLELAQRFLISAGRTKSRDDSSVAPRDHNRHKKREKLDMARLVPNLDMHTQQNQTSGTRTAMARFEKQRKQNQARQEKYLEAQSKRKTWMQRKVNDGKKAWGQAPGKGERMEGEEEKRRLRSALNERKPLYPKPEGKLYDLSVLEKSREDVWIPPGKPRDTLLHGPDFSLDLDDLSDHLVGFDSNDSAFGGVNGSSDDSDEQPGLPRSLQRRLRDRRRRKKKKYAKEQ